jgi:hypothetical protein
MTNATVDDRTMFVAVQLTTYNLQLKTYVQALSYLQTALS